MLNLNQLKSLYKNSPLWLQRLYAAIPYDIRNGSEYRKWHLFLKQNLNTEEYQILKMKETISYGYENTIYYKRLYNELHIKPQDFNDISDYENLPYIDKDIVRKNFNELKVKDYSIKKTFFVTTGGSSGQPMKFLQSKNMWSKELAFIMNYFTKFGYKPSMLKASFRGGEFDNLPKNQYWKYNPINNEIHFSPFHITTNTIESYVRDLNSLQPKYFHTYPSSLLLLIEQMKDKGMTLNYKLNAIFLISENFTIEDIKKIKLFFNCNISSFYGHSERLIFAPSYGNSLTSYIVDNRYGNFELIDNQNVNIHSNDITGEIVGTSFDNLAMPLIRYKTNDFTNYTDVDNGIISMIEGRWIQEYLIGKNCSKFYLTALNMHSDIFKNVIKYQFHQKKTAEAELHVVITKLFTTSDKINILKSLEQKVGHALSIKLKVVEKLDLTPRGKFKNIVKEF